MCLSKQAPSAYKRKKNVRFYQCFHFTTYFPNCLLYPKFYVSQLVSQKHIYHYAGNYLQLPHRYFQSSFYGVLDIFKIFIQPIHTSILLVHTPLHESCTRGHKTRMDYRPNKIQTCFQQLQKLLYTTLLDFSIFDQQKNSNAQSFYQQKRKKYNINLKYPAHRKFLGFGLGLGQCVGYNRVIPEIQTKTIPYRQGHVNKKSFWSPFFWYLCYPFYPWSSK